MDTPIQDSLEEINHVIKRLEVELKDEKQHSLTPPYSGSTLDTTYSYASRQSHTQPPSSIQSNPSLYRPSMLPQTPVPGAQTTNPAANVTGIPGGYVHTSIPPVYGYLGGQPLAAGGMMQPPQTPFQPFYHPPTFQSNTVYVPRSQSPSFDGTPPQVSRVVYAKPPPTYSPESAQLLERINVLENRLSQCESREQEDEKSQKMLQEKLQEIIQFVNFQEGTIDSLSKQNQQLSEQLNGCVQMQAAYQDQLKEYKIKVLSLQRTVAALKESLANNPSNGQYENRKKLDLTSNLSGSKRPSEARLDLMSSPGSKGSNIWGAKSNRRV